MATHEGRLREALLLAHGPLPVEQLFGVRPEILDELHTGGISTRVYVPYRPRLVPLLAASGRRVPRRLTSHRQVRSTILNGDDPPRKTSRRCVSRNATGGAFATKRRVSRLVR